MVQFGRKHRGSVRGSSLVISLIAIAILTTIVSIAVNRQMSQARLARSTRLLDHDDELKRTLINLVALEFHKYATIDRKPINDLIPTCSKESGAFSFWYQSEYQGITYYVSACDNTDASPAYTTDSDETLWFRIDAQLKDRQKAYYALLQADVIPTPSPGTTPTVATTACEEKGTPVPCPSVTPTCAPDALRDLSPATACQACNPSNPSCLTCSYCFKADYTSCGSATSKVFTCPGTAVTSFSFAYDKGTTPSMACVPCPNVTPTVVSTAPSGVTPTPTAKDTPTPSACYDRWGNPAPCPSPTATATPTPTPTPTPGITPTPTPTPTPQPCTNSGMYVDWSGVCPCDVVEITWSRRTTINGACVTITDSATEWCGGGTQMWIDYTSTPEYPTGVAQCVSGSTPTPSPGVTPSPPPPTPTPSPTGIPCPNDFVSVPITAACQNCLSQGHNFLLVGYQYQGTTSNNPTCHTMTGGLGLLPCFMSLGPTTTLAVTAGTGLSSIVYSCHL